jgi:hypothetical protein
VDGDVVFTIVEKTSLHSSPSSSVIMLRRFGIATAALASCAVRIGHPGQRHHQPSNMPPQARGSARALAALIMAAISGLGLSAPAAARMMVESAGPCSGFEFVDGCVSGGAGFFTRVIPRVSNEYNNCAWSFSSKAVDSNATVASFCALFTDCAVPGFDEYDELQHHALLPNVNTSSPWLVSAQHPCLRLTKPRFVISWIILAVVLLPLVPVAIYVHCTCCSDCASRTLRPCTRRLCKDFECTRRVWDMLRMGTKVAYLLVLCAAAGLTAVMARMEQVPNPTLLPMFSLFAMGIEAFHYLPELEDGADEHANDPYAFVRDLWDKVRAACIPRHPCARERSAVCRVGGWFLALLLVAATVGVCMVAVGGMLVQSASAYETETVQIVALLDVVATWVQGFLLMCAAARLHRYHAFESHTLTLGLLTVACGAWMTYVAVGMANACVPEQYLVRTSTDVDFIRCGNLIEGHAHGVTFWSIARQFLFAAAAVLVDFFKPNKNEGAARSANAGKAPGNEHAPLLAQAAAGGALRYQGAPVIPV